MRALDGRRFHAKNLLLSYAMETHLLNVHNVHNDTPLQGETVGPNALSDPIDGTYLQHLSKSGLDLQGFPWKRK